ncbi:MAG: alpha-L-arabinofuranosidase C-terminal domain-containing protein [Candidatus Hodarchaeota archaeon]
MSIGNKIVINIDSNKKYINPMIYSNFIEHIGECIHNGIWAYDPVKVSLIKGNPRLIGIREDLLKAVKDMRVTVLRWPGGCYSDVYHWKDAIGDRDSRKVVENIHWNRLEKKVPGMAPIIQNQFGTDEFLTFCEEINAEPYININYGTGTPEEAAEWVEYCNGTIDTQFGNLRAKNGREDPYNVKIWGIANEIFGFWESGYEKNPIDYATKYLKFAEKMREKDPKIKLVACGSWRSDWNQPLLHKVGETFVDYLSIHRYLPHGAGKFTGEKHPDNNSCYHALMASKSLIENYINKTWDDIIKSLGDDTHVRIAFDEWGVWYLFKDAVKTNFNLQDGLWTAMVLMTLQKMTDKCPMANWAQLVNCMGTIQTDPEGLILTPIYLAFKTIVDNCFNRLVEDVHIQSPTFDSNKYGVIPRFENVPYIESNTTINDTNNEISIAIINKHFESEIELELELNGFIPTEKGLKVELTSESPFDYNTIENRTKIEIKEETIEGISPEMQILLKPHSLTILKLKKK